MDYSSFVQWDPEFAQSISVLESEGLYEIIIRRSLANLRSKLDEFVFATRQMTKIGRFIRSVGVQENDQEPLEADLIGALISVKK